MNRMLDVAILLGSVRRDRIGIKPARYLLGKCEARGFRTTLVDPLEYSLPLLDRMYKEHAPRQAPEVLERLAEVIRRADAYLIVSAEYNHSIPPALSNLIDHFLEEYFYKASAIACYSGGPFGGVRAAMQLRAMLGEIGTVSIPSILPFPKAGAAFDDDLRPTDPRTDQATDRFLAEFAWYASALKRAREQGTPP
jgi:NAD(P)H-dependent FMN reductase